MHLHCGLRKKSKNFIKRNKKEYLFLKTGGARVLSLTSKKVIKKF